MRIREIDGNDEWGLRFIICANAETLGFGGDDTGGISEAEAISMVVGAAGGVILDAGFDYDSDGFFPNWNGGKHCQFPDVKSGGVVCRIYHRDAFVDDDGEPAGHDEWEWRSIIPGEIRDVAERVCEAARDAMDKAIAEVTSD